MYGKAYALIHQLDLKVAVKFIAAKQIERNYVVTKIKNEAPSKVLDLGCSSGFHTNLLSKLCPHHTIEGADISIEALEKAREDFPHLTFHLIEDGFYENKHYDLILLSHVLEHIEQREPFVKRLSQMLSPKGKIIICIPQERIRGDTTLPQIMYAALRKRFKNPHVTKISYDELNGLLSRAGLWIEDYLYTHFLPPFKSSQPRFSSYSLVVTATRAE